VCDCIINVKRTYWYYNIINVLFLKTHTDKSPKIKKTPYCSPSTNHWSICLVILKKSKRKIYLESGSRNRAIMMVASTMHVRYMVLISNISESGGLSRLSMAWFPITQKFEPHNRNSSSDSIVLLSPRPPPWAPLDNTAYKRIIPLGENSQAMIW